MDSWNSRSISTAATATTMPPMSTKANATVSTVTVPTTTPTTRSRSILQVTSTNRAQLFTRQHGPIPSNSRLMHKHLPTREHNTHNHKQYEHQQQCTRLSSIPRFQHTTMSSHRTNHNNTRKRVSHRQGPRVRRRAKRILRTTTRIPTSSINQRRNQRCTITNTFQQ